MTTKCAVCGGKGTYLGYDCPNPAHYPGLNPSALPPEWDEPIRADKGTTLTLDMIRRALKPDSLTE